MKTEQKIEMERRLAMQAMERADGAGNIRDGREIGGVISKGKSASGVSNFFVCLFILSISIFVTEKS